MDWDDIIIGSGQRGTSAVIVFDIPDKESISDGGNCFWISDCFLDVGMTVFKNCPEGKAIQRLIDENASKKISAYLDRLVLECLPVAKVIDRIHAEKKKSFEEGREANQNEMQEALRIKSKRSVVYSFGAEEEQL